MKFEPVIGLELHVQLNTATKIFCGCSTSFGALPNMNTCPVCLGMPGVLPVLNRKVIEFALLMAIATHCKVESHCRFARKNYFYPDLPKGYQISQYESPLAQRGYLDIERKGGKKRIGITRIHLEEDAGKLIHDPHRPLTQIDYNRTGIPLMEVVSEPDLRSPEEAGIYLRKLRLLVQYLGISAGRMEEGNFRCDTNISLRPEGSDVFGTRTELKNLNSFKHVEKALQYEIDRQREILIDGGQVIQETRLWDPDKNRTIPMRGKEDAQDYRYFPDPDLLPMEIDDQWIDRLAKSLPELPDEKRKRFIAAYPIPEDSIDTFISNPELADYFEACIQIFPNPTQVSNWILGNLLGLLNAEGKTIAESPISPWHLAKLLMLIDDGTISGKIAKTVFEEMSAAGDSPEDIVKKKGLVQVTDESAIEAVIQKILSAHSDEVSAYKNGKTKLLGFFVGQVMKETRGKANPKVVNDALLRMLEA